VVDPRPSPSGQVILYAALSSATSTTPAPMPGIWRSDDSGDHFGDPTEHEI